RRSRARAEKQAKPQAFFLSLTDFLHFPQTYRNKKRVALHHHDIALGSALSFCHGEYVPPKFLTEFQPFHNLPTRNANRSNQSKGKRFHAVRTSLEPFELMSCPRATHRQAINFDGRKPYSNGHGLAVFAARSDTLISLQIRAHI